MSKIHSDINAHDNVMLALSRTEFTGNTPKQLATETAQKYTEVRRIVLDELRKHTNPRITTHMPSVLRFQALDSKRRHNAAAQFAQAV